MIDWLQLAESLITSPWLYAVLIAVSCLDSFLPLIPSEAVVVVAGVYAASGHTDLVLVIAATTLGAFLGDMVPYVVGRLLGARVLKRLPPGTKRRAAHDWFTRQLDARGGFVLVTTRFIPVGRYLATLSTGIDHERKNDQQQRVSKPEQPQHPQGYKKQADPRHGVNENRTHRSRLLAQGIRSLFASGASAATVPSKDVS